MVPPTITTVLSNSPPKFTSLSVGDVPHVAERSSNARPSMPVRLWVLSDTRTLYLEGFGIRLVMDVVPRNGAA